MGNADVTTRRLFDKIDMEQTYPNSLTSRDINGFRIPIVMENDNLAIRFALHTITARMRQAAIVPCGSATRTMCRRSM